MRGCLAALARVFAVILAALFVVTTVISLILTNIGWWLFSPDTYKRVLVGAGVYERMPELVGSQMATLADLNPCRDNPSDSQCAAEGPNSSDEVGGPPEVFSNLSASDWEFLLKEMVPPAWMQTQVESILDQTFAWLDTDDLQLTPTISMVEFKQRLTGDEGVRATLRLIRTMPYCGSNETNFIDDDDGANCRPLDSRLDDPEFTLKVRDRLQEAAADIPDQVPDNQIATEPETPQPIDEKNLFGRDPKLAMRITRDAFRFSLALPALLLALVTLFGVRSRRGLMRWWGVPLTIGGVLSLATAIALIPTMLWAIDSFVLPRFPPSLSQDVLQIIRDFAIWIGGHVALPLGIEALIVAAAGVSLLAASSREKNGKEGPAQIPVAPPAS